MLKVGFRNQTKNLVDNNTILLKRLFQCYRKPRILPTWFNLQIQTSTCRKPNVVHSCNKLEYIIFQNLTLIPKHPLGSDPKAPMSCRKGKIPYIQYIHLSIHSYNHPPGQKPQSSPSRQHISPIRPESALRGLKSALSGLKSALPGRNSAF